MHRIRGGPRLVVMNQFPSTRICPNQAKRRGASTRTHSGLPGRQTLTPGIDKQPTQYLHSGAGIQPKTTAFERESSGRRIPAAELKAAALKEPVAHTWR